MIQENEVRNKIKKKKTEENRYFYKKIKTNKNYEF